jgi:hypothetical protein
MVRVLRKFFSSISKVTASVVDGCTDLEATNVARVSRGVGESDRGAVRGEPRQLFTLELS